MPPDTPVPATRASAALIQVGWYGPYGIIPGGMDNEPNPNWRPLYVERAPVAAAVNVRRLRACVEAWPEAETGKYDPRCCRFPKSCSADVYDEQYVTDDDLEPRNAT